MNAVAAIVKQAKMQFGGGIALFSGLPVPRRGPGIILRNAIAGFVECAHIELGRGPVPGRRLSGARKQPLM